MSKKTKGLFIVSIFLMTWSISNGSAAKLIDSPGGSRQKVATHENSFSQKNEALVSVDKEQTVTFSNVGSGKIEGAIGILTTSNNYRFGDTIGVYKPNGKLLTILKRTEEYQVIALKCLALTKSHYQVLLDNGEKGLVSRYSKHIEFQTWEEHMLSLFAVGFNEKDNPLMAQPSKEGKKLDFKKDEFYHPIQIKADWLKVEWDSGNKKQYGWVRWKNKERLIVELYYFA